VPFIGHPAMGSGEVGNLIAKPENWQKTYILGFKNCSYGPDGKLPNHVQEFVDRTRGKIELDDTILWWVVCGVDAINLIARAVKEAGSTDAAAIINHWNTVTNYPGLYASYSWSKDDHNGLPQSDLVMSEANTQRQGAYKLAPGYS
jgi:branched-chain amino acid transport system substrate-binding protein